MADWSRWERRLAFWRSVPRVSYAAFLAGVFLMFLPIGLLGDIARLGAAPPERLAGEMILSGGLAVAYVLVSRRPRWFPVLIAFHILITWKFDWFVPPRTTALTGEALRARLQADANAIAASIIASFVLLSNFVQREGSRYVRAHTEIALARDIHRLLVPAMSRRIGPFEFQGFSLPSGEVGGDLVDVVESNGRWIGYVADVSGHGVGAGLLMGMFKSAARTQLLTSQSLDHLLNTLNVALFDLKKPEMFVTFAGIHFDVADLSFSVAGHLPILHYRAATATVDELSIPQIPVAMFDHASFSASPVKFAPGDLFAILTDGLTEVFDRQDREFGLERIKTLIRSHATEPLGRVQEALLAAVRAHGRQLDDQTLLLIRVTSLPQP
jgi:serine phosphatase RsbU (regulator of sigma subunit)